MHCGKPSVVFVDSTMTLPPPTMTLPSRVHAVPYRWRPALLARSDPDARRAPDAPRRVPRTEPHHSRCRDGPLSTARLGGPIGGRFDCDGACRRPGWGGGDPAQEADWRVTPQVSPRAGHRRLSRTVAEPRPVTRGRRRARLVSNFGVMRRARTGVRTCARVRVRPHRLGRQFTCTLEMNGVTWQPGRRDRWPRFLCGSVSANRSAHSSARGAARQRRRDATHRNREPAHAGHGRTLSPCRGPVGETLSPDGKLSKALHRAAR